MTTEKKIDTAAVERHRQRADDMGDSMRRYLVLINTGGIGVLAAQLSNIVGDVPSHIIVPLASFALGLAFTGGSIWLQKVKALKRQDAAEKCLSEPSFKALFERNETYDGISFALFMFGAAAFFACHGVRCT